MEKHLYICEYCSKKYLPRRRHKQRFCSNSCRVNAHNRKKKLKLAQKNKGLNKPVDSPTKDGINLGGIGNAAIANVATEIGKQLLIKEEDKPLTRGEFRAQMKSNYQRYIPVKNIPKRDDGASAYFDISSQQIVHFKILPPWK